MKKNYILILQICVAFLLTGFFIWPLIMRMVLTSLPLHVVAEDVSAHLMARILFSIVIALLPLFVLVAWRLGNVTALWQKLTSAMIVCILGGGFIMYRLGQLNSAAILPQELIEFSIEYSEFVYIEIGSLYIEYYLLAGWVVGSFMAGSIFKRVNFPKKT